RVHRLRDVLTGRAAAVQDRLAKPERRRVGDLLTRDHGQRPRTLEDKEGLPHWEAFVGCDCGGVAPAIRPGSDRAATCSHVAAEGVVADNHDDGADHRDDDRRDVDAGRVVATGQQAGEEPADEAADDAEHDVSDDAEALVTLDEVAGEPAGDRADDEPRNDSHGFQPSMYRWHDRRRAIWAL